MFGLFSGLNSLLKTSIVQINGYIFDLNTVTVVILLAFSLILGATEYVGAPMLCVQNQFDKEFINSYCWVHSTYVSLQANKFSFRPGLYPGISVTDKEIFFVSYYQWVCFTLFLQAVFFYLPNKLWEHWEHGKMLAITANGDLNTICSPLERSNKLNFVVKHLIDNHGNHRAYALKYYFCELFSIINVVCQAIFVNYFLDYKFFAYGWAKMFPEVNSFNLFPTTASCNFKVTGSSGNIENKSFLCLLALNILNEKIYTFMWGWLIFTGVIYSTIFMFHIFHTISTVIRVLVLKSQFDNQSIIKNGNFGDFFMLKMLQANIDHIIFKEILKNYSELNQNNI